MILATIHKKGETRTATSATARQAVPRAICTAVFLTVVPVPAHALPPDQVFNTVKDAVVVVKTLDTQGRLKSQGSGVLISPGRVATNCHVVRGGPPTM